MKRLGGVTILAVIAILLGSYYLLLALLNLLTAFGVGATSIRYSLGGLVYTTIISAVFGALCLAFGIGASSLKGWAWTVGVVTLVLSVVSQMVGVVRYGFSAINAVAFIIVLLLLWYLFRPHVRAAFGRTA
jgi:hypothetical protein